MIIIKYYFIKLSLLLNNHEQKWYNESNKDNEGDIMFLRIVLIIIISFMAFRDYTSGNMTTTRKALAIIALLVLFVSIFIN